MSQQLQLDVKLLKVKKLNQSNQKLKEVTNQFQILEKSSARLSSDSLKGRMHSTNKRKRKD